MIKYLSFAANHGQTNDQVKLLSRGRGYTLFPTSNEAMPSLSRPEGMIEEDELQILAEQPKIKTDVVRMNLVGGNPTPILQGLDKLPGKSNFFIGSGPGRWRTDSIITFFRVAVFLTRG